RMLGGASHSHKVNFCKFTNETRNSFEAAEEDSGQKYIAAVKGSCAGGGYELALACNHIMLTDDSTSSVALPEVPLLAVLPGTGGLTRLTDKRKMRRDRADVFCSTEEGIKGKRAVEWRLVDEVVPNARFDDVVRERAFEFAKGDPEDVKGVSLTPIERSIAEDGSMSYSLVEVAVDREARRAVLTLSGPSHVAPDTIEMAHAEGADFYLLKLCRELEDAILHLRLNEVEAGTWVFRTQGDGEALKTYEE
ncbi:MAG: enoyl-CoA hydratase/isomerase family protein, partial [Paracoccaceae bacterium]